ncbi:hypothetical protein BD779DRAFT_1611017 [Infundibulicybe gibba]|nr:hypothetical protein BD779DRAFT_1611017 [Infundibulicybe gibba]
MATLPRGSKHPATTSSSLFHRPQSEFDAGINTSTAWTEHLESGSVSGGGSLSDEEPDNEETETHRSARALYRFEGKVEFRELSVEAGDDIEVVKEELADVGLLPRSYYTFTSQFTPAPNLEIPESRKREASVTSITPRGSPKSGQILPIIPQNTGEWRNAFPNFRQSLLGGKSLNRFSSFVTSGAEEWVLKGTAPSGWGEADQHFVDAGPAWKEKLPPFRVLVHSPSKRTSVLSGAFTIYSVTSLFHAPPIPETDEDHDGVEPEYLPLPALPGIALPPLPEKQYAGRFSEDFVEARRGDLERYIGRVVRHPIARYAEVVTFFLGCESDIEWKRTVPHHLSMPPAGPAFYARVFHPAFNLDADDAKDAVERFDTHTHAVSSGVQSLRNIFGRIREARVEMSKAERLLSYSLLSLITEEEEQYNPKDKGLLNDDGAWCWRENCKGITRLLKLTKAMQKTSDVLQGVADLYDTMSARRTQLATHESLKGMAHPSSLYEPVVSTHRSTLSRYKEANLEGQSNEEMASRCETVLNTTMAEMETYHTQKCEDFSTLTKEHLDGEIAFYEQVLGRLQSARGAFDQPQFDELGRSPRKPSIYERELENPRLASKPLLQPCPHVFDSAPMRPVSVAIQEGVGMLLGPAGRGSVFGKFWS